MWVRSRWRTIRRSRRRGGQGTKEKVPETPVKGRKERVVETPEKEKGKDKSLAAWVKGAVGAGSFGAKKACAWNYRTQRGRV